MSDQSAQPIDASTRYCAVFGHPVRHSASPAMHNAAFAALGINWRYLAFDVFPDTLRTAIEGAKVMNLYGLNLTVPHKMLAVGMVEALDASAQVWGAINTIRFEAKDARGLWKPLRDFDTPPDHIRSHGFNTDADGLAQSLREDLGLESSGICALILGAGGAGRTATLKLAADGATRLYLINRTQSKSAEVAREIQIRYPRVEVFLEYPKTAIDLCLNATSLGLKAEDPLPFDESLFNLKQARLAYDMVYRPAETRFLAAAKAAGCRTANGLGMLLHQGAKAQEIWTGIPAPIKIMQEALVNNIYG